MAKKSGGKREAFFSRRNFRKTIRRTLHLEPHPDDVEDGKEDKDPGSSAYFLQTVRQGK